MLEFHEGPSRADELLALLRFVRWARGVTDQIGDEAAWVSAALRSAESEIDALRQLWSEAARATPPPSALRD